MSCSRFEAIISRRRKSSPNSVIATTVSFLMLLGISGAFSAVSPAVFATTNYPMASHGTTQSTNWSGYAVTGSKGSVTAVYGSWIEPKISGTCPSKTEAAAFWVGIDGYTSKTVEQTGTDSDCSGGVPSYYAWYEFYPKSSVLITSLTISPGDVISAQVTYSGGKFTIEMKDVTTGHSFTKSGTVKGAKENSAEFIAESPCCSASGNFLPLTDFGTVSFGGDSTSVSATCYATINGVTGSIGSFSSSSVFAITMINNAGTKDKATPSALSSDGSSFTITWDSAGP